MTVGDLVKIVAESSRETVPAFFCNEEFEAVTAEHSMRRVLGEIFDMQSLLSFPLQLKNGGIWSFYFYSRRHDAYNSEHIALIHRLQETLVRKLEENRATEKIGTVQKTSSLPGARSIDTPAFGGIIGNSHLLLNVFDQIAQVAPFDTSVLVLGETGTGKERIADCIHNLSSRKAKPLVKVNCAALPSTLIESELFGHAKGSFTGATEKRTGKFEQANGGTIFLDEIGEMPVDLQVKFLRVLQEKEIEPIGGNAPVKIDVRVIAATNRNLEREVAEGRFRLDLYYRLNVFPITLPPLRDRIEDIPALVSHFISVYNHKSGKMIDGLSEKALKNIMTYDWPGNIRQLEHLIERSVLVTKGNIIEDLPLPSASKEITAPPTQVFSIKTIHENERDYIIQVLKKCGGKIWGAGGAAEVLNLPPSTLKSKMKKLGIRKEIIE